jgi:beta-lactam-binding protein with PASTA domain
MSSKSQNSINEQMLRDRLAQVEEAFTATEAFDARKRALALSANDAARAWSGFARRPAYGATLARHDAALRADITAATAPAMAATLAAVRRTASPLPADSCRIWGIISGRADSGLTVTAIKPGGAVLVQTNVAEGGQYMIDTRCKDKMVTLEIRDEADRLLLHDGAPVVVREGVVIERSYTIDRCGDMVPDRPIDDGGGRTMPDLIGKTAPDAESEIARLGQFKLSYSQAHDPADKGIVIAQDPAADTDLAPNAAIALTLSRGAAPETKMPDLIGKTTDAARKLLTDLPYAALTLDYVDDPDNAGRIVRQDPDAGAPLGANMRIMLCVGEAVKKMPDVIGQSEAAARKRLVPAIAGAVSVSYSPDGKTPGMVIDQDPAPGKSVGPGTAIRLVVTEKPGDSPTMPDLRGMSRSKAEAAVAQQGDFKITARTGPDAMAKGSVYAQNPTPGAALAKGAEVTINVSTGPQDDLRLPNVVGLKEKQAREALVPRYADDLAITRVSADMPAGTVVNQSPKAGTTVTFGDAITLDIAQSDKDRATLAMPDLHGLTSAQAKKALKNVGISNVVFDAAEARRRNSQVVRQQPAAGRQVTTAEEVRLKFGPKT